MTAKRRVVEYHPKERPDRRPVVFVPIGAAPEHVPDSGPVPSLQRRTGQPRRHDEPLAQSHTTDGRLRILAYGARPLARHGLVEQVRLVSTPVRLADMTLLSAAKTWRFHPAQKDGRAVKYRLPMSWAVSPP